MNNMEKNKQSSTYAFFRNIFVKLCTFIPVSSKYLFFESEIDFAENARAIYEYMHEDPRYRKYHLIWNVKEPEKYLEEKNVKFISIDKKPVQWYYYLNRCKFFILTHPCWLENWKKNQIVINTWHGNPFKAPPEKPLENVFDYMLASSEDSARFRKKEFNGVYKMVILGAPRNDFLLSEKYERDYLSEFVDAKEYQKIVYCMPTYKKAQNWTDGQNNPYSINVVSDKEDLLKLNEQLKKRNVLLVCIIHHLQILDEMVTGRLSNIIYLRDDDYAQKGIVMNQMLRCADALVTDFSGVFLDYILLDRPIGFFCNDRHQYTRGFAMDNPEEYMPGPHMYTMQDFLSFIDDVCSGNDQYTEFRKTVCDRVHKYQDDKNCQRFLEYFNI